MQNSTIDHAVIDAVNDPECRERGSQAGFALADPLVEWYPELTRLLVIVMGRALVRPSRLALALVASVVAAQGACATGSPASPTAPPAEGSEPAGATDNPYAYVAKVKNVLTGLPASDAEVLSVARASDPESQLRALIRGWMAEKDPNSADGMTYYAEKMLVFFELATQQTQIGIADFLYQSWPRALAVNPATTSLVVQNAIEGFARTLIAELVDEGRPATLAATTTSFMMTTALMEMEAWLDAWQVDDSGMVVDRFAKTHPGATLTVGTQGVSLGASVDATSPSFMHWTDPDLAPGGAYATADPGTGCATDPIVYAATGDAVHYLLYGTIDTRSVHGVPCPLFAGTRGAPQLGNPSNGGVDDFRDWRMVTVRQPEPGESPTAFYDLPSLRRSSTLVLDLPRVGFFTTPAFFANWPTNPSNAMRVTMNQTLIVALGAMVDGADGTLPKVAAGGAPIPGLDSAHATPGTACYGCHQLLDPTRSILAATYSWSYHAQDLSAQKAQTGEFAFQGVIQFPKSVYDLGGILASHPLFATAWVQKLCHYANSRPCETSDPEFLRIVRDFQDDAFSWNDLVVDLLASPLTTNAKSTATGTHDGVIVSVSRREHLCATLGARLGVRDLCALLPTTTPISPSIPKIASGFPSDGYGRGVVAPVLPNQPSLFFRAGTENLCEAIAPLVIDNDSPPPGVRRWSSASSAAVTQAILDFVPIVMGLVRSDPRFDAAGALLRGHFEEALGAVDSVTGEKDFTAHDALQSTFVVACETPSAVSLGM